MDRKFILMIFAILSEALCTGVDTPNVQDELVTVNSTESANVPKHENVANAVNEFGFKLLLTMMKQNKDQNIVISPTSIAGLLAMTLLGTVGRTHEELAETLGFSQNIIQSRKNHEQFGELLRTLNTNDSTSKTLYADAMFVDSHATLRGLYRVFLERVYNGDALSVDFKQTDEVKDMINQWVASHTEGNIENFLQKPLPTETQAVLLSALYFRGQWKNVFLKEYTAKMAFKNPTNEIMADLMLNMGQFNYIFSLEDDLHMVALPYNDSITTMYVLKPHGRDRLTLHDLMTRLDSTKIDQLIDKMKEEKCIIRFPKMDLQNSAKLENPLKALGVKSLFTPGQANFALMVDRNAELNKTEIEILSRIKDNESNVRAVKELLEGLPNPGLHVDSVIHDVKLTINEYGTEAVAATSGILARTANLFYADSPFYVFIRNEKTNLNTFSAIIYDPTAKY